MMRISKATWIIALATGVLILLTAWATMLTEKREERSVHFDTGIISAIQSGDAEQLSKYFTDGINFYCPETGKSNNKAEAREALITFFTQHKIRSFTRKRIIPGRMQGSSYIKGTLVTTGKNYGFYGTIFNNKIEQLDITVMTD
ncbi:MAG: DUF4783 domain-containing protein [Lewinellaceae bacterium]|nr:DUF4783 domain-containing protein [Lewinellaceae bacterium]